MERKHSSQAKFSVIVWFLFTFNFVGIFAETCEKIDVCSCRKSNGKVISLRDVAGGAKGPAIKGIKTIYPPGTIFEFDWNPCTTFTEGSSCTDMLICQTLPNAQETHPCANSVASFESDTDGNTVINYEPTIEKATSYKRTFKITLKCDPSKFPGYTDGVTEDYTYKDSKYSMVFSTKCACDDACASNNDNPAENSNGLSYGSIILIVFFVLLFVYLVAGILIKWYKMEVETVPEVIPNYEF